MFRRDTKGMDPLDALERVVYLLDRLLAPSPKVQAFQRAITIVCSLGNEELERLHHAGKLTELPGIGKSTASVIGDALDQHEPRYLNELETSSVIPIGRGGPIRAALKGDCHSHSLWSDGGAPIMSMAQSAQALGHEYLALTDHSARLTIAHGLNSQRLSEQLIEVEKLNEMIGPFQILTGMEVDILEDGTLDLSEEMLATLDVVVASVHSKLSMPEPAMTARMLRAIESPHVDVLGHCTGRKVPGPGGKGRSASNFDAQKIFEACERTGTAVEINCRPERQDPPDDLLALARDLDCVFTISTDAHAPGQLEWQPYGCDKAALHNIEPSRIMNTQSANDLLKWTSAHA